jgi:hypothetical protein
LHHREREEQQEKEVPGSFQKDELEGRQDNNQILAEV